MCERCQSRFKVMLKKLCAVCLRIEADLTAAALRWKADGTFLGKVALQEAS